MSFEEVGRGRAAVDEDLASGDEEIRRVAVELLLALPTEESIPRLLACLGDASWRVRKAAVAGLASVSHGDHAVAALIEALADGENPGRRNAAVEALVARGRSAVPRLVENLGSDDVDVRKLVVDALAGIGDASATPALIATLDDPDPNTRGAAADALGVLGGDAAIEALRARACCEEEDRLVRLSALRALAALAQPMDPEALGSVLADPILRPAGYALLGLAAGDDDARRELLKGLGSTSSTSRQAAIEGLLSLLASSDGAAAAELARSIREAANSHEGLVDAATERLEDGDLTTRLALVQFLGIVGRPESVVPILSSARDEALAEVAHRTIAELGESAEAALCEAWPELDRRLRRDAARVLGRFGGERGTRCLRDCLEDADAELRAAAALALGERGCGEALPDLVRHLGVASLEEEWEAGEELEALASALLAIAGPEASDARVGECVELLCELIDGSDEPARRVAARLLAAVCRSEGANLLVVLLRDPSAVVRRAAAEGLGRLDVAVESLRLASADESPLVRVAAATALGASRREQVLDDLARLVLDEDVRVRAAAVRAVGSHGVAHDAVERARAILSTATQGEALVAVAALEALAGIGGAAAAQIAAACFDREEPELVQAAVACVARHGDATSLAALLPLVQHESWAVRADAIAALAERRFARALPAILRRRETERDAFVRDAILRALPRLEA